MSKKNEVPDSSGSGLTKCWLDLGEEVVNLICQRLEIKRGDFKAEEADRIAGSFARDIGLAALAKARTQAARLEADVVFKNLGVRK